MNGITVVAETVDLTNYLERMPEITRMAARMAINDTARDTVRLATKIMGQQVAFPAGYLKDRLSVTQAATDATLQATIQGRDRPTSLARFAASGATPQSTHSAAGGTGLAVMVKPGNSRTLKRAFLVRLNSGNIGLAIRLKPGEVLHNKREFTAHRLSDSVYLLYGPSVDQVFSDVAPKLTPEIAEQVANEFSRQFVRLSEGTS